MLLSLYVHFPFCRQKCMYCDFVSGPCPKEEIRRYCDFLISEIRGEAKRYADAKINTVFFGGGTPSVVPAGEMERVISALRESFQILPDAEFTSEANPGTLTEEWLEVLCRGGMNRLSLGVQSSSDALLKKLGRIHTFSQASEAVRMARAHGIRNLNTDVMFALPGQSLKDYLDTLDAVAALSPTHISAYSLIPEEGTPLMDKVRKGEWVLPGEDEAADQYEAGLAKLQGLGYHRYEISNFATPGCECRHNIGYWQGAWYLGLGVAAHSMLPSKDAFLLRRANPVSLADYAAMLQSGGADCFREQTPVSREEAMFECVMLGLRTSMGVNVEAFTDRFGETFEQRFPGIADQLCREGLATGKGSSIALTDRGLLVENAVLMRFMDAKPDNSRG